jgi:hypothetical protein
MAHELQLGDDSITRVAFIGDMGKEEIEAYIEDNRPILETATEAEPQLVLYNASREGKMSAAARKALVELNRDPRMGKMAVIGARRYTRVLVSFVLKASRQNNVRFFDLEQEAVAWLKAER